MFKWKVYQVEDDQGNTRYMIASDNIEYPETHLDLDEEIVTDCWLSDLLKCEPEDIFVVPQPVVA